MKTTTIPPLRVAPELRKEAEALLEEGETLSGFLLDAVTRNIAYRKAREEFIGRGLRPRGQTRFCPSSVIGFRPGLFGVA